MTNKLPKELKRSPNLGLSGCILRPSTGVWFRFKKIIETRFAGRIYPSVRSNRIVGPGTYSAFSAVALSDQSSISWLLDHLYNWGGSLSPRFFSFFLELALMLALVTITCFLSFTFGSRSKGVQWTVLVLSILTASLIPVQNLHVSNRVIRTWLVLLSIVVVPALVKVFPRLLVPELGKQRRISKASYVIIAALFILNFLTR